MAERKAISARTRFNIFKRDGFACQYCGATPPGALLHVDHITPVKNGGGNEPENLVTACDRCNLGKAAVPLSVVPQSLGDRATEVAEREKQIKGFNAILQKKKKRIEDESWDVAAALEAVDRVEKYDRLRLQSIQRFLERLPFPVVMSAAETAVAKRGIGNNYAFRYFCGICWKTIKEAPVGQG